MGYGLGYRTPMDGGCGLTVCAASPTNTTGGALPDSRSSLGAEQSVRGNEQL